MYEKTNIEFMFSENDINKSSAFKTKYIQKRINQKQK